MADQEPGGMNDGAPDPGARRHEDLPAPRRGRTAAAAVLAGLVLLSIGIGIGWGLTRGGNGGVSPGSPLDAGRAHPGLNVQAIASRVDPAVVDVGSFIGSDPFGSGGGPPTAQGAGTGMVVTSSGEILTNNHVIEGATRIEITIPGRSGTYAATVIGADPSDDVALLRIGGVSGLPTVSLADSSQLAVGQAVVAIGNALGQGGTPTVTVGTVSALGRSITVSDDRGGAEHLTGLIQTDAAIQPGDSGGALANSAGQVVGMLTAAARGSSGGGAGSIGFAIPSGAALSVMNDIRAGRASDSVIIGPAGYLGIGVRDMDASTAARLGLAVTSGALVLDVTPETPAARAGISQDAVITAIDGRQVTSIEALGTAVHRHKPGEQVQVTWVDRSGTRSASVGLIAGPAV